MIPRFRFAKRLPAGHLMIMSDKQNTPCSSLHKIVANAPRSAGVVELVDTQDLKSCSEIRSAGSIPAARTTIL